MIKIRRYGKTVIVKVECITMSGKAGLIKCRRFQLDSHVWDAQDNHISTDWYNFDQANAL